MRFSGTIFRNNAPSEIVASSRVKTFSKSSGWACVTTVATTIIKMTAIKTFLTVAFTRSPFPAPKFCPIIGAAVKAIAIAGT